MTGYFDHLYHEMYEVVKNLESSHEYKDYKEEAQARVLQLKEAFEGRPYSRFTSEEFDYELNNHNTAIEARWGVSNVIYGWIKNGKIFLGIRSDCH